MLIEIKNKHVTQPDANFKALLALDYVNTDAAPSVYVCVCAFVLQYSLCIMCLSQKRFSDNWQSGIPVLRKRARMQLVSSAAVQEDDTVDNILLSG